jgi:hypothetical protein
MIFSHRALENSSASLEGLLELSQGMIPRSFDPLVN